ncbi:hypothetical protein EVAR_44186_1 [Eumeta japonica]|uniref:Uncharacterized protein n=1 Tax=Eumeta variegata TaxID=151549 RepID=A0A4C1W047_EUMVA|nr:hypothetical protein EVAR_44186_1 [Eumeta japonica]
MVVICLTLARRNGPHRLRGLKDPYYDGVYNASQAALGGGGGTLDKRGGGALRDELGYIAPPNRKLPPVPGSNYNTCDRVKRQAVISQCRSLYRHNTPTPRHVLRLLPLSIYPPIRGRMSISPNSSVRSRQPHRAPRRVREARVARDA